MEISCVFKKRDVGILVLNIIMKFSLWFVTVFSIYALIKIKKFRERASNVIMVNLLISDSLNTIFAGLYGAYLRTCDNIRYNECTYVIVVSRTFTYISMAFMVFLSVERYFKVVTNQLEYNLMFSKSRVDSSIAAIWILLSFFSVSTTPFWIYLITPEMNIIARPFCTYSTVMEPLVGIITLILANFLPTIFLIVLNTILAKRVRYIFLQSEKKLNYSDAQKDKNKQIVKKVELNIFMMSFALTIINLLLMAVLVYDMYIFICYMKDTTIVVDKNVSKFLTSMISFHPMLEAFTCFLLNKDMVELFGSIFYTKFKKPKKVST